MEIFDKWRSFLENRGDKRPKGASKPILAAGDEVAAGAEPSSPPTRAEETFR